MSTELSDVMKVAALISRARHEETSNIHVAEEILVTLGLQEMTTAERVRRQDILIKSLPDHLK